jgi:hypothetical protein
MSVHLKAPRKVYTHTLTPELKQARRQLITLGVLSCCLWAWLFLGLLNCSIDPEFSTEYKHPLGSLTHNISAFLLQAMGLTSFLLSTVFWSGAYSLFKHQIPKLSYTQVISYLCFLTLCTMSLSLSFPEYDVLGVAYGGIIGQSLTNGLISLGGQGLGYGVCFLGFVGLFALELGWLNRKVTEDFGSDDVQLEYNQQPVKSLSNQAVHMTTKIFDDEDFNPFEDLQEDFEHAPRLTEYDYPRNDEELDAVLTPIKQPSKVIFNTDLENGFYDERDFLPSEPIGDEYAQFNQTPSFSNDHIRYSKEEPHLTGELSFKMNQSPLDSSHTPIASLSTPSLNTSSSKKPSLSLTGSQHSHSFNQETPNPISKTLLDQALSDLGFKSTWIQHQEGQLYDRFDLTLNPSPPTPLYTLNDQINRKLKEYKGQNINPIRCITSIPTISNPVNLSLEVPKVLRLETSPNQWISEIRDLQDQSCLYLGRDFSGHKKLISLQSLSSLLVVAGQSIAAHQGINSILVNLIYQASPKNLRILLIDPQRDPSPYQSLPHLYSPIIDQNDEISQVFKWFRIEHKRRLSQLSRLGAKSFTEYQDRSKDQWQRLILAIPHLDHLTHEQIVQVSTLLDKVSQSSYDLGLHIVLNVRSPSAITLPKSILDQVQLVMALRMDHAQESTYLSCPGAECLLETHDVLVRYENEVKRLHTSHLSESSFNRILKRFKSIKAEYIKPDKIFIETVNTLQRPVANSANSPRRSRTLPSSSTQLR